MTQVMSQSGYGLPAPSSRQDIVSALLDGYGNDFDDSPSYQLSPDFNELPPPPPEKDDTPLTLMNMKFQLRVDEPQSPISDYDDRKNSLDASPPTKIVYRSLSRSSKPRELKLTVSNGSTAVVPSAPALPAPSIIVPSPTVAVSKPLPVPVPEPGSEEKQPLPPPPPPEKSTRRQPSVMGNVQAKIQRDRKDSVESQDVQGALSQSPPVVKRKALPDLRKFKSLADLGVGPRGGKNGPLPPMPASKNSSQDSFATITPASMAQERSSKASIRSQSSEGISRKPVPVPVPVPVPGPVIVAQLVPTPGEQQLDTTPAPPKKTFTLGLPPNPRARGQETPTSAKHVRGKSSTGFDLINSQTNTKPAPVSTRPTNLTTITPDPTPSPNKTSAVQAQGSTFPDANASMGPQSPVSPVSLDGSRRPFSYEAVEQPAQSSQVQQPSRARSAQEVQSASPVSPPAVTTAFPPRTTSRPGAAFQSLPQGPKLAPQIQIQAQQQPQPQPQPPQLSRSPSPPTIISPTSPAFAPPFPRPAPNTEAPSSKPVAPITDVHLNCYASHATHLLSRNEYFSQPCMVCYENSIERKWTCTWCYVRVCLRCADELIRTPGRNLSVVIERRGGTRGRAAREIAGEDETERSASRTDSSRGGTPIPQTVIWEADEDKEDFS
ncbi:hypothetical protein K504DRAFT_455181 [Pleomassaria siparia CBS 279.74]|uniref:Uncharacterized protein n=1 Tax=Pleomassaria siparia CBS 279.74 TaxID=1314801 RepID=A0A6G1KAS9_9PLEO|nr:hypothetical protein K504DRAFT_455181 [Pleomassaria siparia CBS 279.74]